VVYKRYASLFFIAAVDNTDNELITLEVRFGVGSEDREEERKHPFTSIPPSLPPSFLLFLHQMIHLFVEILDRYFGNVCELDIIFNFHKVGREEGGLGG